MIQIDSVCLEIKGVYHKLSLQEIKDLQSQLNTAFPITCVSVS